MQTKIIILYLLLIYSATAFSQNQIVGKWLSEDKGAITSIYEHNGKFYGKLIWLKTPNDKNGNPLTDTKNSSDSLKERPLIDLVILNDFSFKDSQWKGGTIYDPKYGETYTCTMWLTDKNKLKVRGYWGVFYLTQTWSKTN